MPFAKLTMPKTDVMIHLWNLETDDLRWVNAKVKRERWAVALALWLLLLSSEFLDFWESSFPAVTFDIGHVAPWQLPLLVTAAQSILTTMNLIQRFLMFLWSLSGVLGTAIKSWITLMLSYATTLKHWSDHVLTNSACKVQVYLMFFWPWYNLHILFVQFVCLTYLKKLLNHSSSMNSCFSSKEFT